MLDKLSAEDRATQAHKEECELRLAKAFNTPKELANMPWPKAKKATK